MTYSILRMPAFSAKVGLSRSTIYERIKNDPDFPKPISLGSNSIGFIAGEADAWLEARIAESRKNRSDDSAGNPS